MRINIEPIRKKDAVNSITIDYMPEESGKNGYKDLLGAEKINFLKICGEVFQKNGIPAVDYRIEADFSAECARCGNVNRQIIETSGQKYIADKSESEEKDDGENFYITESDGIIDLNDFIVEFIGIAVPFKYLCSEDCRGLCPKCGKNLNEGVCSCPSKEKNPAFKILDGFFGT